MVPINLCQCGAPSGHGASQQPRVESRVWLAPRSRGMEAGGSGKGWMLRCSLPCRQDVPRAGTGHWLGGWGAGPRRGPRRRKWTERVPACCGLAPGRRPPQMQGVHLISGQSWPGRRACLLRTASTFPAPGVCVCVWGGRLQCCVRLRSLGSALLPGEEKLATRSAVDTLKLGFRVLPRREVGGTDPHWEAPK